MIKQLAKCIREYKKLTVITLLLIIGEVVIEIFIPFITANLVDKIDKGAEMSEVIKTGLLLAGMAVALLRSVCRVHLFKGIGRVCKKCKKGCI